MRRGSTRFGAFGAVLAAVVTLLGVAGSPAQAATGRPFVNHASGKCLEIADWRTDVGAPARQWDCTGGANQQWQYMQVGPGIPADTHRADYLLNLNSSLLLEIADWRTDNGAPARQWIYGGSRQANMEWSYCSNWPGCMTD
ncbi:RICIN domain-containing protein [Kitasatospora sp. NPDC057223]|uniref:RICIN domain-containing protein n=1 Tax=Kitasatospora sp. NPDC057223 TaxID=3346055 RepID=UPI003638CBF0